MARKSSTAMQSCFGAIIGVLAPMFPMFWLQSFAGYLGLALVFVWGGALRGVGGTLFSAFEGVFANIGKILILAGEAGHWAIILLGLDISLIFAKC